MKSKVVFGNPGTGKTYNIVENIKEFKELGYSNENIQVLSHTKTAASEIASRANGSLSNTVHSLSYRYGKVSKEQVPSIKDIKEFSGKIGIPFKGTGDHGSNSIEKGDEYLAIINKASNLMNDPIEEAHNSYMAVGSVNEFTYFYKSYLNWKKAFGIVDFNDMIVNAIENLDDNKAFPQFKVLIVDEAQDLSPLQWCFIYKILDKDIIEHVVITGDPDQSIFSWGGAQTDGMERFAKRYGSDVSELTQSYRVPKKVYDYSNMIIDNVFNRYQKEYLPTSSEGIVENIPNAMTNRWDKIESESLILYRTHALRREIERELISFCLPYDVINGIPGLFNNKYGRVMRALHRNVLKNEVITPNMIEAMKSVATKRGKDLLKTQSYNLMFKTPAEHIFNIPIRSIEYYNKTDFSADPILKLSTIHGAKGMESENVYLLDGITQRIVEMNEMNEDDELRVWFVGATRSKNRLNIINSMEGESYLGNITQKQTVIRRKKHNGLS